MILSPLAVLKAVADAAEAAYPEEACGLLVGRRTSRHTFLSAVVPSHNVSAGAKRDRFEVDPKVRFDVMRSLEGTPQFIVGHYHSHPDHPCEPSPTDLEMAFEPDLIWLIVSVVDGQVVNLGAFQPAAGQTRFKRLTLRATA